MLCQNCKINDSTIHLYTNVNGHQQQVDLCQNCYQIMKTDPNNKNPKPLRPNLEEAMVEEMATAQMGTVVLQDQADLKLNNNKRAS